MEDIKLEEFYLDYTQKEFKAMDARCKVLTEFFKIIEENNLQKELADALMMNEDELRKKVGFGWVNFNFSDISSTYQFLHSKGLVSF